MKPKEKAKELVNEFEKLIKTTLVVSNKESIRKFCAKECALIAVDEILSDLHSVSWTSSTGTYLALRAKYWREVKQEIEKL